MNAIQSNDQEFIQVLFNLGANQLSLEQRKRIIGKYVVDSGNTWLSRITNLEKIGNDVIRLEFEIMVHRDDSGKVFAPAKRDLFFSWNPSAGTLYIIQIRAYGTAQGNIGVNNNKSNGFAPEKAYLQIMQRLDQFFRTGKLP